MVGVCGEALGRALYELNQFVEKLRQLRVGSVVGKWLHRLTFAGQVELQPGILMDNFSPWHPGKNVNR